MNPDLLPPGEQIATVMSRIYGGGMTTTSGGNISVRGEDGALWISPAGVDKGTLSASDVIRMDASGRPHGPHAPSSEHPFHRAIYACRPDLGAIIHAHPPALVSFSIVRRIPDTSILPQAQHVCGPVGYAPYELPGSEALGERIAAEFEDGYSAVVMENHGTVVGGRDVFDAYQRFETLEFCARTIIRAETIGQVHGLTPAQIDLFAHEHNLLPELDDVRHPADERALRAEIVRFVRRACDQQLMISTYGTVSVRWRGDDFVITPTGIDRRHLEAGDLVQIRDGRREPGKVPSRSVQLHRRIYAEHPHVRSIILTQSPNAVAFCVSNRAFDTRTIPESYVLLQDTPLVAYGSQYTDQQVILDALSPDTPVVLVENDCVLVTGRSLLDAFDRLEVAEFSARSLIDSAPLGQMVPIDDAEIAALRRKFIPQERP